MFKYLKFFITFLSISSVWAKLPADVKKCTPTDKECIINNINHIFQTKLNGDPEFGLVKLFPIDIGTLVIRQEQGKPIGVNITATNMKMYGVEQTKLTKIKGFGASPDGVHELLFETPKLSITGDYKVSGKILILPVVGEGTSNFTFDNHVSKIKFEGKSLIKDDQVYLDVVSFKLTTTFTRFYSQLDNLFNGDKALGDQFNKFINDEWELLEQEFHEPVAKTVGDSLENATKMIFSSTPYNEIFNIAE